MMGRKVAGIAIPDSRLARDAANLLRDTASELLFRHSMRVFLWGVLTAERQRQSCDRELLFVASMFHDFGLTDGYKASRHRFEVDGANAARDFLRGRGIGDRDLETVWTAVALHTTPGIPQFMGREIALLHAGAGMDVSGRNYGAFAEEERQAVVAAFPRDPDFKHRIIDTFYEALKNRPETTFGTFNDDFLAFRDPSFQRADMCTMILESDWDS